MHKAQDPEVNQELYSLLESVIVLDSNARLDIDDDKLKYVASGNPVEVAMLNFLFSNHCDVPTKLQNKELKSKQFTFIPFSSRRKRSLVAQQLDEETVRIVVKGAPEYILNCCTAAVDGDCAAGDFGEENATQQFEKITEVIEGAQDGMYLKPITYAYKDMSIEDFEALKQENNDFE